MPQNIYDDPIFQNEYDTMRENFKGENANDTIEIPIFRRMIGDVKNKTILDLGCGYGENDRYFKELGAKKILGIDISTHMLEIANKINKIDGVEYRQMAMEDISDLKEKYDIVISSLAFHYIEDFNELIKDIYNLLNDDGVLLFSQEHPMITCFNYSEGVKKNKIELNGKKYRLVKDYNRLGKRENLWFGANVIKYHRNITVIINTLINNGFIIDEIDESTPPKELNKNSKYMNQYDIPLFLFVKAHKVK